MRIIAGQHRGRRLLSPESKNTRPITDRVKQSLFDILVPRIPDAIVYDLFAGTGSMGLECLSRGAKHSLFFESDPSALMLLRKNIASLSANDHARIIPGDLFKWFAAPPSANFPPADLLFLDPPYRFLNEQHAKLLTLAENFRSAISTDAVIIFRHSALNHLDLPGLITFDQRVYGDMMLEFMRAEV